MGRNQSTPSEHSEKDEWEGRFGSVLEKLSPFAHCRSAFNSGNAGGGLAPPVSANADIW
jgi:hypothetical protein